MARISGILPIKIVEGFIMKVFHTLLGAVALLTVVAAQSASAAPSLNSVYFNEPSYGGSGCPQGSASSSLTPDGLTLTMLFDSYTASPTRKTCNISIPVHVPNGFQVSTITADYRGFAQGTSELKRSYFFAGGAGPSFTDLLGTAGGATYLKTDNLVETSNTWSRCGADVNMRINSAIRGLNNRSNISVDSLDLHQGMVFHLQYRPCR